MKPLILAVIAITICHPNINRAVDIGGNIIVPLYKAQNPLRLPDLKPQAELASINIAPTISAPIITGTTGCGSDPNMAFIYQHESGCRTNAMNPSGAYGLCQALPASKMATAGADWQTSWATQNAWCIGYADSRYGSPYQAMLAWQAQGWW